MNSLVDRHHWWEQSSVKILTTYAWIGGVPARFRDVFPCFYTKLAGKWMLTSQRNMISHVLTGTNLKCWAIHGFARFSLQKPIIKPTWTCRVQRRFKPWLQNKLFPSASLKSTQKLRWQGAIELDLTVGCSCGIPYSASDPARWPIYNGATSRWIRKKCRSKNCIIQYISPKKYKIYIYYIVLYIKLYI